jgi:type III restriction enzyme
VLPLPTRYPITPEGSSGAMSRLFIASVLPLSIVPWSCDYSPTAASEAFELDRSPLVAAWVKNDHLGFEITYSFRGIIRKFRPDYLVRFANRKMLVLEVKGQDNQEQQTKREFLSEWVRAVNGHGGFGVWASDVSRNPTDIHEILQRHG